MKASSLPHIPLQAAFLLSRGLPSFAMARKIERLYIHTAATPGKSIDISAASIDVYHRSIGWNEIGYNAVARFDGRIEAGREEDKVPAGVSGDNLHSLHLCLSGNGDLETPPKAQWDAAVAWCVRKIKQYGLVDEVKANPMRVLGHREVNVLIDAGVVKAGKTTKTCPGAKVDMKKFRRAVLAALG